MQRMMSFWLGALMAVLVLTAMAPGAISGGPDGLPGEDPEDGDRPQDPEGEEDGSRLEGWGPQTPEPEPTDNAGSPNDPMGRGLVEDEEGDDGDDGGEGTSGGESGMRGTGSGEDDAQDPGDEQEDQEENGEGDEGQGAGSDEGSSGSTGPEAEEGDEDAGPGQGPGERIAPHAILERVFCVHEDPQGRCANGPGATGLVDLLLPNIDDGTQNEGSQDDGPQGSDVEPFARSRVVGQDERSDLWVWGAGVGLFAVLAGLSARLFALWYMGRGLLPAGWRLDRERVVNHPVRRGFLDHLKNKPGATIQELADEAGVANSRAAYHLSVLKREECVSERVVENRRHFFLHAAPAMDPERLRKRTLVRSDRSPGRVLVFLRQSPGATVSHVARALGFSPGHAHYHLTKLAKEGLLDRVRRGRRVRHYLTSEGHELVAPQEDAPVAPSSLGSSRTGGVTA